jgi:hypothetical protein
MYILITKMDIPEHEWTREVLNDYDTIREVLYNYVTIPE